ncbi:MAG: primosomal protein N' [Acidobacteria bacterium]|nr:primosomal protein N' [Acidobacteriota bacterium]
MAVAVPAPLLTALSYRVPDELSGALEPGTRVRVPLGRRSVVGVVLGESGPPPAGVALKEITAALDPPGRPAVPPDVLATLRWTADYYVSPPGETLRAALPAAVAPRERGIATLTAAGREAARDPVAPEALRWLAGRPGARARIEALEARAASRAELRRLVEAGFVAHERESGAARGAAPRRRLVEPSPEVRSAPAPALAALEKSPARRRVLAAALAAEGAQRPSVLAQAAGSGLAAVQALIAAGRLVERFEAVPAPPVPEAGFPAAPPPVLTPDQAAAAAHLKALLDARAFRPVVLYGITGSGKTEVYLRAAEQALAAGQAVLFLVPEIGLTPQLAEAVGQRLGGDAVVLHSGLSDRQRFEAWERVRSGASRVVVGARSAVFAPLANLALIVVDEEHDAGYKQEEMPRYHARDLALVRGRETGAVVVLGSATPSMEAWNLAEEGRADLLRLPTRATGARLATLELVDMRQEFRETKADRPFSRRLVAALQETMARGEQAMVLLNRRGYTRAVLCRACGESIACAACSIALTWHRVGEKLRCHYCGHARARPPACPTCQSPHLADVGSGTQLAEEALAEALPGARIARLDRDAVRSGERLAGLLGGFARGAYDVMVGTQMIAKGHHFPRVTLVGVLSADAALRLPDFRAAERTFQLLTQVAGRAGRGDLSGRVLVQAFRPDHPALTSLVHQDFETFARRELAGRRLLRYPPAAGLAQLIVRDADLARAEERAALLARRLREAGEGKVAVLGPTAAPLARLRGQWRIQILARALKRARLGEVLRAAVAEVAGPDGALPGWLVVDVDPQSLL